ncbi:MAG: hypothetical protein E6Q93_23765 [Burkholderiaceae bacterium]|nr:MAG: hypothetical protein E6Q93_23765 [Burkholderiaceae bacterium]
MNYWLTLGLVVGGAGVLFYCLSRGAKRRIMRDGFETANSGAIVVLGYGLPLLAAIFLLIGFVQLFAGG